MERYQNGDHGLRVIFSIRFILFLFSLGLQFNLLALTTSAVRTRAVFGARFKLLSVGAGS